MRTSERLRELTKGLSKASPASDTAIEELSTKLGYELPPEYVELMRLSNGGDGQVGEQSYLALFPVDQIIPINEAAAVAEFAPGFLIFGSNGMGVSYAFDTRNPSMPIVECVDMDLSHTAAVCRGRNLLEFLEYLVKAG